MDILTTLIEKGTELKKKISKNRNKVVSNSLKDEVSIWKNQCVLYIDSLKISKFIQTRFKTAAFNLDYNGHYDFQHIDEMLNFLKALQPQDADSISVNTNSPSYSNKVFIVHGHNKALRTEVKNVLLEIGLKPVVLSEQANGGKTIIEKFEEYSGKVNFAIILMTADDEGKALNEKEHHLRARQNVILEMGFFIASLKRSNVFLLLEDNIELPSDINGVGYASINDNWKNMLVKELRNCGYNVSADNLN